MIAQGKTSINDWKENTDGGKAIFVEVDTSHANFKEVPHYLTSLEGKVHHWDTNGINCIYNATKNGFKIFIMWSVKREKPLTPEIAKANGWYVKWTGILVE